MFSFEDNKRLLQARIFSGANQKDRMVRDKRKTLDRVTLGAYQGDNIKKLGGKTVKGLINPNKNKPDYDDKILSVRYEHGFTIGDVFEWEDTKTHWLIYLQDLTELAYFRGDIRRCSYQIFWRNESNEEKSTYAAIRGPSEGNIKTILASRNGSNTSLDVPNYTLSLLLPCNEDTLEYFQRYAKFYLPTANKIAKQTCWQVEAVNSISTPGILEVYAKEYYSNVFLDDVANGIVDGLVEEPINPTPNSEIVGETHIKAQQSYVYEYQGVEVSEWVYNKKLPIQILRIEGNIIEIKWVSNLRGSFDLQYGSALKTIVVDSLF